MKLCRWGAAGIERPALWTHELGRRDLSGLVSDLDESFFLRGGVGALVPMLPADLTELPRVADTERWGPPVARPSKIVCVGLNYRPHAEETGARIPREPVLFMKATSCIAGVYDEVRLPPGSEKTDYEVELAVVIGERLSYAAHDDALRAVAGYTVMNDVSERHYQIERSGQWVKGKSADTFGPLGPVVVTPDEVQDPQQLHLWLKVNGELRQSSSTSAMIFPVAFVLSYISQFMTLLPGDVVATGTPEGVGLGRKPPEYLKPGDILEYGIDGIGTGKQAVVSAER